MCGVMGIWFLEFSDSFSILSIMLRDPVQEVLFFCQVVCEICCFPSVPRVAYARFLDCEQ